MKNLAPENKKYRVYDIDCKEKAEEIAMLVKSISESKRILIVSTPDGDDAVIIGLYPYKDCDLSQAQVIADALNK